MATPDGEHVQYDVDVPVTLIPEQPEFNSYSSEMLIRNNGYDVEVEKEDNFKVANGNIRFNDKNGSNDIEYLDYSKNAYSGDVTDDQEMNAFQTHQGSLISTKEESKYQSETSSQNRKQDDSNNDDIDTNQNLSKSDASCKNSEIGSGCTLYVRNLPSHLRNEDVKEYFSAFGEVIDCRIVINPVTKDSRGFGFVSFNSPDIADMAMAQTDQVKLEGKVLRIEKARRNRPHDPTPGQYKGPTGVSIKYSNRSRMKSGCVPYMDFGPNKNIHHNYHQSSSSYNPPSSRHYSYNRNTTNGYDRTTSPRRVSVYRNEDYCRRGSYGGSCGHYSPVEPNISRQRENGVSHVNSRSHMLESSHNHNNYHHGGGGYHSDSIPSAHGKTYYNGNQSGNYVMYSRSKDHSPSYCGSSRWPQYKNSNHGSHRDMYIDSRNSPKHYHCDDHIKPRSSDHETQAYERGGYGRSSALHRGSQYNGYYSGSGNNSAYYDHRPMSSGSSGNIMSSNSYEPRKGNFSSRGHGSNPPNWYAMGVGGNNNTHSQDYMCRHRMASNCDRKSPSNTRKHDQGVSNQQNDKRIKRSRVFRSRSPITRSHHRSQSVNSRKNGEIHCISSNQALPMIDNYSNRPSNYHVQYPSNMSGRQPNMITPYSSEFGNPNTDKSSSQRKS